MNGPVAEIRFVVFVDGVASGVARLQQVAPGSFRSRPVVDPPRPRPRHWRTGARGCHAQSRCARSSGARCQHDCPEPRCARGPGAARRRGSHTHLGWPSRRRSRPRDVREVGNRLADVLTLSVIGGLVSHRFQIWCPRRSAATSLIGRRTFWNQLNTLFECWIAYRNTEQPRLAVAIHRVRHIVGQEPQNPYLALNLVCHPRRRVLGCHPAIARDTNYQEPAD